MASNTSKFAPITDYHITSFHYRVLPRITLLLRLNSHLLLLSFMHLLITIIRGLVYLVQHLVFVLLSACLFRRWTWAGIAWVHGGFSFVCAFVLDGVCGRFGG